MGHSVQNQRKPEKEKYFECVVVGSFLAGNIKLDADLGRGGSNYTNMLPLRNGF